MFVLELGCSLCTLAALLAGGRVWWSFRKSRLAREQEWARLERSARAQLDDRRAQRDLRLPEPLAAPVPRLHDWQGGYVSYGGPQFRAYALRLLQVGVVRPARVLLAEGGPDGDGGWDGRVVYAFRGLDGQVQTRVVSSSVDAMHAGLSRGTGRPEPAFDLGVHTGGWLHVLLDPNTGEHLIYEALLLGTEPQGRG